MLKIEVTNRRTRQTKAYSFTQNAVILGREPGCDVILESSAISRRHARITVNKHLIEIEDLGSGNGTIVNQTRIPVKEKTPLTSEDSIRIEEYDIKINLEGIKPPVTEPTEPQPRTQGQPSALDTTDPDILEIKMIKKVLGALDHEKLPSLTVVTNPFKNKKAVFEEKIGKLVIGRDPGCQLVIDSPVISRQHACVMLKWGGCIIKDMGSKNGTFLNGERIEEKSIKDGDEIVFGTIKSLFKNPQEFDMKAVTRSLEAHRKREEREEEGAQAETTTKPEPQPETKPKPEEKKTKPAEPERPKEKTETPPSGPISWLKQFSLVELALFGFGAFVIVVAIFFMLAILGK